MMRAARFLWLALVLVACSQKAPVVQPSSSGSSLPASSSSPGSSTAGDWLVYHHDPARTGVSADHAPLGRAQRAWSSAALDGAIYAQPLVAGDHVIVATEANSVYSLDATSGRVAWRVSLGAPVLGRTLPCGNIDPSGITGTPAIDIASRTIHVVAFVRGRPHHELYALSLDTGGVRWHRGIDPPGLSGRVEQQRGALALHAGRVYVPFGGLYGDCGPYKGAVVSAALDGKGALESFIVPTSREAGIWNPAGPVIDAHGDVWVTTGNSESRGAFDYGDSVIRLSARLKVIDYFAPSNWRSLNAGDVDLGSLGPVLLDGGRVLGIGKDGRAYLLDARKLGHVGGAIASADICGGAYGAAAVQGSLAFVPCNDALVAVRGQGRSVHAVWDVPMGSGPPVIAGGAVWAIGYDGNLRVFDLETGAVRFSDALGSTVTRFVTPSAANGRVFAPARDRIIAYAMR